MTPNAVLFSSKRSFDWRLGDFLNMNGQHPKPGFRVQTERDHGSVSLRLHGELDLACQEEFEDALHAALDANPAKLTVDLRELEFIDSTGLRLIVQADVLSREKGLEYAVICGDGQVRRAFELTGMYTLVPVLD